MIDNKWNAKFEKVLLQLRTLLDKAEYQGCGNFKAVRKGDLMVVNLDDEGFCRGKICQFYVETLCKLP